MDADTATAGEEDGNGIFYVDFRFEKVNFYYFN